MVTRAQCLVRQWIHDLQQYLAPCGRIAHISTSMWTRILRCSVSGLAQNGEVCAQPMLQLSVPVCEIALGNLEITSEVHVVETRDDGGHLFLSPWWLCQLISTACCGHTHPVSELASKTTTTTTNNNASVHSSVAPV